jgi:hypothetical protein
VILGLTIVSIALRKQSPLLFSVGNASLVCKNLTRNEVTQRIENGSLDGTDVA